MSLAALAAKGKLVEILNGQTERVRKIRDCVVASLEDDIRIDELQDIYLRGVSLILEAARETHRLSEMTGSKLIKDKSAALVAQVEAVYRLVA